MLSVSDKKALLACSVLVSRGDFPAVRRFLEEYYVEPKYLLLVLLEFVSPLEDLLKVVELKAVYTDAGDKIKSEDALEELIGLVGDVELVDQPPQVVDTMFDQLIQYVANEDKLAKLRVVGYTFNDLLKACIRKTNLSLQSLAFVDHVVETYNDNKDFNSWNSTIIQPLIYYNTITTEPLFITKWEELSEMERLNYFVKQFLTRGNFQFQHSFLLFLSSLNADSINQFIESYVPLSEDSFLLFAKITSVIYPNYPSKNIIRPVILNKISTYEPLTPQVLDSILNTLQVISNEEPTNKQVTHQIDQVQCAQLNCTSIRNLQTLDDISTNEKEQEDLFNKMIANISNQNLLEFSSNFELLRRTLFPQMDSATLQKSLLYRLLESKSFQSIDTTFVDKAIVIQHFWACFKNASSGHKELGEMSNALASLQLIHNANDDEEVQQLFKLLDSVNELSQYSLYFQPSVPFRPIQLMEIENLNVIIQKVLELNELAYTESDKLYEICENLAPALNLPKIEKVDIICSCIESSLVYNDFDFAITESNKLLDSSHLELSSKWPTFFQVGKYVSPDWFDDGTPEPIIHQQMALLSKLLKICLQKDSQIIIAQWTSLQMDLSIRQEEEQHQSSTNNQQEINNRSLESRLAKALSSTANEIMRENNGAPISSLLSNGLGWAIGAKAGHN